MQTPAVSVMAITVVHYQVYIYLCHQVSNAKLHYMFCSSWDGLDLEKLCLLASNGEEVERGIVFWYRRLSIQIQTL
jgi:hypothetical protein